MSGSRAWLLVACVLLALAGLRVGYMAMAENGESPRVAIPAGAPRASGTLTLPSTPTRAAPIVPLVGTVRPLISPFIPLPMATLAPPPTIAVFTATPTSEPVAPTPAPRPTVSVPTYALPREPTKEPEWVVECIGWDTIRAAWPWEVGVACGIGDDQLLEITVELDRGYEFDDSIRLVVTVTEPGGWQTDERTWIHRSGSKETFYYPQDFPFAEPPVRGTYSIEVEADRATVAEGTFDIE